MARDCYKKQNDTWMDDAWFLAPTHDDVCIEYDAHGYPTWDDAPKLPNEQIVEIRLRPLKVLKGLGMQIDWEIIEDGEVNITKGFDLLYSDTNTVMMHVIL